MFVSRIVGVGSRRHAQGHWRCARGEFRAITQLSVQVQAPAFQPVTQRSRARVIGHAGHHCRCAARQPAHAHRRGTAGGGPIAELPVTIEAPTLGASVGGQRAGVLAARNDG